MFIDFFFLGIAILIAFGVILVFRSVKHRNVNIPKAIPENGLVIPIYAVYYKLRIQEKISKHWLLGYSRSPYKKLWLYNDHCQFSFIFKTTIKYQDIEKIEYTNQTLGKLILNRDITIYIKNKESVYSIGLDNEHNFKSVLKFFESKNVPLSDDAKKYINS